MSIEKITNTIANSSFAKSAQKNISKMGANINSALNKGSGLDKFLKVVEPTGANNSFVPMMSLMVGTVIVPRVITASTRNKEDKEKNKDEIKEILFRDVQTVTIMLFLFKAMNSLAATGMTKLKGLPMVNRPYEKLFNNDVSGSTIEKLKANGKEFLSEPAKKLTTIGKNFLDTFHPTEGVRALTNDEFVSKYSRFSSLDELEKVFANIDEKGGDSKKVFGSLLDSLISAQKKEQSRCAKLGTNFNSSILNALVELKNNGNGIKAINEIENEQTKKTVENIVLNFFKDEDNELVRSAKGLNAMLRTVTLAIESGYLGFGLPALNQKRLEKKYLKENPEENTINSNANVQIKTAQPAFNSNEQKIFSQFI